MQGFGRKNSYFYRMFRSGLIVPLLITLMIMPYTQHLEGQCGALAPSMHGLYGQDGSVSPFLHPVGVQVAVVPPMVADKGRESSWSLGADLVSSYIWRGSRQGSGPHIQPFLEFSAGLFTAGAWGTTDLNGYEEADLWFAFDLPGGFTAGMQDYYLPELPYFDFSDYGGSHAFELNLDWDSDNVWLSANCILNEAGGIGSYGQDLYFEVGFSLEQFSLFMGAGNGWHTEEGGFNVCNLGLETAREIRITDRLVLPVRAQLVFNPDREQLFVTAGITLSAGTGD
jgi:hypothetical protein